MSLSSSGFMMSYWLTQSSPLMLESPSESTDDAEDDDGSDDVESESHSECSKEYDDDDFDNKSLEIDEEERHKITAQINPDEDEEDDTEEEEKEEILEKEDSDQEKNQGENDDQASASPSSVSSDRVDDDDDDGDKYQGQATTAGQDDGETSMTESAESRTLESYGLIQKLESERKQLLQELSRDEQHRQYFYNKLKTITQKMESLQQTETNCVQMDIARRELEMEAYQVQEAMHEKLGLQEESKLRQDARLDRVHNIEREIVTLQMLARKPKKGMRDDTNSSTLARDDSWIKIGQEGVVGVLVPENKEPNLSHSLNLSTQTGEVTFMEIPDGIAPGIPLSSNHLSPYHSNWTLQKAESGSLFSSLSPSQDLASLSFSSMNSSCSMGAKLGTSQSSTLSLASEPGEQSQNLGTKVEMVYSLLSMLGTHDKEDMSRTLFAMSQSQDNCIAMRQAGCLPLLIQILHGSDKDSGLLGKTRGSKTARARASAALHNIVHCHHDDKRSRREARTLRLLEQIRAHCDQQREDSNEPEEGADTNSHQEMDHHPGAAIAALMKLSFDEDYRHAICSLGGLQAIAELLEIDNRTIIPMNDYSTTIRRYSCMALTNLTFGDGKNKALLCSVRSAMESLTDQLRSTNEDLIQAAASVLRNLSWRADLASKKTLREIGVVTTLMKASMSVKKETTLKSILSALWNLSSHCSENKAEICAVEGALQFLVSLLTYKSTAKTLAIIENGGGILRNVSSHIAIREDYRQILRKLDCLKILLCHLKSPSLTIVSNACGTLWNLSARCEEDQNALRDMGAISMLRNLVHSRHKMISSGSSAALKNLLSSIPPGKSMESDKLGGSPRPSLHARKQRALEAELDHTLSETCENVDSPRNSPTEIVHRSESEPRRFVYHLNSGAGAGGSGHRQEEDTRKHMTRRQMMPRNGVENMQNFETSQSGRVVRASSQDSVRSTHSDISHDRTRSHTMLAKTSFLLHKRQGSSHEKRDHHTGVFSSMSRSNYPPTIMIDSNTLVDQNILHSSNVIMVNDVPAHLSQSKHNHLHHQQHQYKQGWQTMPNHHKPPQKQEVANLSDNLHGPASLTQSAPSHCQTLYQPDLTNNQQQQSLLERLAKSSSGLSGSCNLNNSITVANSGIDSSMDYSNHISLSIAADEDRDQPVNYSMKYQDGILFDRNSKPSSNGHMHLSYDHIATASSAADFRHGTTGDLVRSGGMTASMNERNQLMNNSLVYEKVPINNRQAVNVSGNTKTVLNSAVTAPHRPVPNLVHNRFHHSEAYQPHHQPNLINSQPSCVSSSPFNSLAYQYSSNPVQTSNHSLPSLTAAEESEFASQGKTFNTGVDQFNTSFAAHHVSHVHPFQHLNISAKLELESRCDDPRNINPKYSELDEENYSKDYQQQPINYSLHSCRNGRKEDQDIGAYNDVNHCIHENMKYTDEFGTSTCSDNQTYTFSTGESPYLPSAAKVFTELTQSDKQDRERANLEADGKSSDENFKTRIENAMLGTDFKKSGYKREPGVMASVPGFQTAGRHSDSPTAARDTDKSGLDLDKIYNLDEDSLFCSGASSASIHHNAETKDNQQFLKRTFHKDEVDEISETLSRSSSSESLSSCELQAIHNSVSTKHIQMASELVPSTEIMDIPLCLSQKSSSIGGINSLLITPKSKNVVTKQSLNFDKTYSTIKPESFTTFATFDEEDKPIQFAMKSPELSLAQPFPRLDIGQATDFTSYSTDQEQPHLTFSTFQKNFQPPNSNQSNHFTNRLCIPRAKTLPTLIEQMAEIESSSGGADLPGVYTEEKSPLDPLETTNQNGIIMSMSARMSQSKLLNQQSECEKLISINVEEKQFDPKIFQKEPFADLCGTKAKASSVWSPVISQNNQGDTDSTESTESEESEVEEDIPPKPDVSTMPMMPSADTVDPSSSMNTIKKKSGIPMKMSPGMLVRAPAKISSIPKPSPIKSASSSVRYQFGNTRSSNSSHCEENLILLSDSPELKSQHEKQFYGSTDDHKTSFDDDFNMGTDSSQHTPDCAIVVPFPDFILTDTARIHLVEETSTGFLAPKPFRDTTTDLEKVAADPVGVSRIPKIRKDNDSQRNDGKIDITQKPSELIKQKYRGHAPSVKNLTGTVKSMPQDSKTYCEDSLNNEGMESMSSHPSSDSLHVFDVHGIPLSFSRKDSPKSVIENDREGLGEFTSATLHMDQKCPKIYKNDYSSIIQTDQNEIGQSNTRNTISENTGELLHMFYIEGTPDGSSRNSSLNSLSSIYKIDQLETSSNEDNKDSISTFDIDAKCEANYSMPFESVSEMLANYHPPIGEEVHLKQGTNSLLRKSKLPMGHSTTTRPSKTRFLSQMEGKEIENCYNRQGPGKSTSLKMTTDNHSSSETDHGSQSSLSHNQSSSENSMSHSCSDTPYLELDFQIPPFLSKLSRCNTWCQQSNRCQQDEGSSDNDEIDETYLTDFSPEETERLLSENVNLIMSEIQTTKLSGSSIDEDLFIENETISLVSNGYTSDTNSEMSVTWSVTSDKTSSATLTRKQIQASSNIRKGGPKVIKPETAQCLSKKTTPEKDGVKSVRGRRKPLYPSKPNNVAVAIKGNIKVVTQKNKATNIQPGNNIMAQNGAAKSDATRAVSGAKKAQSKNSNIAQISVKTIPNQSGTSKNKSPPQKIVNRRSRSAGPSTTLAKNSPSLPTVTGPNKTGPKVTAIAKTTTQASQLKLVKPLVKIGEGARGRLNPQTNTSVSSPGAGTISEQSRLSTGTTVSPGHSRIPTGTPSGQSKIPNANSGNRNVNNLTVFNNKKNNRTVGQATRSASSNALSSAALEKKTGQNASNTQNNSPTNAAANNRNPDSGIPRRKSSGSSSSLNNTDSSKHTPLSSTKRTSPVILESSKRTSPVIAVANKTTSSSIADSNRHTLTGNTNIYRRTFPSNSDINKYTSPSNTDSNKRTLSSSTDPNRHMSPNNTENNKRNSSGNSDTVKRTPTGVLGKKQTVSKIATLWKKEGNPDKSPLQGSQQASASPSSSKLPVSVTKSSPANNKTTNLPRQVFKTKAATLPNSSLASSKSRSYSERISKSSTYEKISSELQGLDSKSIVRGVETVKKSVVSAKFGKKKLDTFDSSESDTRQGETFDSFDDDDDNNRSVKADNVNKLRAKSQTNSSDDPNDSLEDVFEDSGHIEVNLSSLSNNVDSLEQIDDSGIHIDSRTFRKKKRDPFLSDLDLPNADETCRSMCSLTDSQEIQHINSISLMSFKSSLNADSFIRKMSIIDILESEMSESSEKSHKNEEEKSEAKTKSTVAQGLKKLFSGRHKDKEKESKEKNKESSKSRYVEKDSKSKQCKSNGKHKKGGKIRREYDFFRSNIKIEPSTTWTDEDNLVYDLDSGSIPPIRQIPLRTDTSNSSAIIFAVDICNQPVVNSQSNEHHHETNDGDCSASEKHMTKTEMLLARRLRNNISSSQSDESRSDGDIIPPHAVTSV